MGMEIVRPIKIRDTERGITYTLEFNRASCIKAEQAGVDVNRIGESILNSYTILFRCAFIMHHPSISQRIVDDLMEKTPVSEEFLARLVELFLQPYKALVTGDEEGKNSGVEIEL